MWNLEHYLYETKTDNSQNMTQLSQFYISKCQNVMIQSLIDLNMKFGDLED